MAIQIKIRRDTKAEWDSADPVLLAGELGFELKDSATSGRFKIGNGSREWSRLPFWYAYQDSAGVYGSAGGAAATYYGDRGVWASGNTGGGVTNIMDYIDITTPGNATDFGDLQTAKRLSTGCSNVTRGLFAGGYTTTYTNEIDYIAIATTGNATDFGNLTLSRWTAAAASDGTYGVFGGGYNGTSSNVIDYVTIATPGDASDFGDLIAAYRNQGSCSSGTYGVWGGGYTSVAAQAVQYVTIATTGNATNPGTLTQVRYYLQATSNETYGLWAGGQDPTVYNIIDYVTFASLGNASDFGDLTTTARDFSSTGCSNGTYAVFSGGDFTPGGYDNIMEYVSIATPGNATDFGDRTIASENSCGTSGSPS